MAKLPNINTLIILALLLSLEVAFLPLRCFSDEIWFQDKENSQQGIILGEDDQSIVVRFPKSSIKAVRRSEKGTTAYLTEDIRWKKTIDYLILEIPRRYIGRISSKPLDEFHPKSSKALNETNESVDGKIKNLEVRLNRLEQKNASVSSGLPESKKIHQTLVDEEMGTVNGIIIWNKKPVKKGKVKISLEKYTGFSIGSLKKLFSKDNKISENYFEFQTRTDAKGRYAFNKVPPGYYRLYWMPKGEDGWIHRLRDKPDFEVLPGKLTVQNIPEEKK